MKGEQPERNNTKEETANISAAFENCLSEVLVLSVLELEVNANVFQVPTGRRFIQSMDGQPMLLTLIAILQCRWEMLFVAARSLNFQSEAKKKKKKSSG